MPQEIDLADLWVFQLLWLRLGLRQGKKLRRDDTRGSMESSGWRQYQIGVRYLELNTLDEW